MKRIVITLLLAGVLQGCASTPAPSSWLVQRQSLPPKPCEPLTGDQELVLNLARELAESGRLHAALANLERLPGSLPEARLNKARLLRVLGHAEAEPLYRSLLNTCLVAEGQHGLGQIEVARQNYPQALEHLRTAVSLAPANAAMRNDLGVAYLNLRQLPESRFELMTALELRDGETRAAENLLTLLIYQDDWQQARDLVTAQGLTPAQFRYAEQRAQRLKGEDQAAGQVMASQPAESVPAAPVARPQVTARPAATPVAATMTPVAPVSAAPADPAPRALGPAVGGVQQVAPAGARPIVPIAGVETASAGE